MTLSSLVTSRELSERLRDLGVKQESLFFWHQVYRNSEMSLGTQAECVVNFMRNQTNGEQISAFTSAELGEILEDTVKYSRLTYSKDGNKWCVLNGANLQEGHATFADTETEARGLMLEYLIKNKLITL